MKSKTSQEIRRGFLNYFKKHQHALIASSPVIPHDDPSLLFINAGMNQFKDVFLGKSVRDYHRAATSQKCIRAGGKHNDLENVGHTKRHLTFFEMLGNFSFGDYFKAQAIQFSWEVSTEIFEFNPDKIWPTVFREDDEAFELWTKYVPAERITRLDEKDNFWAMGDTGPCGPSSELLYDRGETFGKGRNPKEDETGERFLEFWNLVFMQFNRSADGILTPLPKPSIDTGAGLERVMSLMLDTDTLFDTDILRALIGKTEEVLSMRYDPTKPEAAAFRVIADHLRSLSFAIADGAQPSNVERGYVLRKILRRAVRYARQLSGIETPFLGKILPALIDQMGSDYPEIKKAQSRIEEILTSEEEAFQRTLRRGQNMLGQIIDNAEHHGRKISGDDAFKLKDTYGFPIDEIILIAKDAGLTVDETRYQQLEQEAKERSRRVQKSTQQVASESQFATFATEKGPTTFLGYQEHSSPAKVVGLLVDGAFTDQIQQGQEGMIILDKTPFYAEMGGQIGDSGVINAQGVTFQVQTTQSPYKGIIAHVGTMMGGELKINDAVTASIDTSRRQKIENNHTATHLLHWALHEVLGEHVKQGGSVVEAERLRFDFNHHKALSAEEIRKIEDLVNKKVRANQAVRTYEISYDEAQKRPDIKQFFGEKYGAKVRVVDIDYSKELCGGTHTQAVGTIGLFRIAKEGSISAGTRRIEAVTGEEAESLMRESESLLQSLAAAVKTQPHLLMDKITKLVEENAQLAKELQEAKKGQLADLIKELLNKVEVISDIPLLTAELPVSAAELKVCADEAILKLNSGVVVFAARETDKCHVMVRVSEDLVGKGVKAGEIVQAISPIIDGKGGGKGNAAQAGGKSPERIGEALDKVRELLAMTPKK